MFGASKAILSDWLCDFLCHVASHKKEAVFEASCTCREKKEIGKFLYYLTKKKKYHSAIDDLVASKSMYKALENKERE